MLKCKSAEVLDVLLSVEPVPFNRGFYAVDITFYFMVHFSAYASKVSTPVNVRGLSFFSKKVILYGSEGSVKTFTSGARTRGLTLPVSNLPTACVKSVDPIVLGSRICDCPPAGCEPIGVLPEEILTAFDDDMMNAAEANGKAVLVTLGVFTIVTLQRNVQIMIPAYDYVLPEKDCITSISTEDPCEMFKRIRFPVNEFFPDDLCDVSGSGSCE